MRAIIQSFIAGFFGPAVFFILVMIIAPKEIFYVLRSYPVYFLPVVWGVWNVLYYYLARHIIIIKKLGIWGGILGLLVSLLSIYKFDLFTLYTKYLPFKITLDKVIIFEVAVYFLVWELIIRYLNKNLID
jgi:hypothetical protein